jgi:shikimate dehydrogenase
MPLSKKRFFGLIGYPLGHSFSKRFFTEKFEKQGLTNCHYELFPIASIEDLPRLILENPHLEGLNVTIPYKEQVLPFLTGFSEEARSIGAVNVIKISEGKLTGYNSDVYGFEMTLRRFLAPEPDWKSLRALVLGTGGAAKAVAFVLAKLEIPFTFVSRNPLVNCLTYSDLTLEMLQSHRLLVQTTPLGMHPNTNQCPLLPYEALGKRHYLYDLVYNPQNTLFLARGEAAGTAVCNGLEMLHLQAERAWEIWNA